MKSQNGVTLTSLAIYIIVLLIVVGILATITVSFQSNIKGINKKGSDNAEIDKFNVYFLKEVKKQGNAIESISDNEILFTTGNKYTFKDDNGIYLNDNIRIAENIEKCIFASSLENGKTVISVTIKAQNADEKIIEYVLNDETYSSSYEDENNYIYKNHILPSEYQQLEYIESTGTQYIDTEIIPTNLTGIYTKCMFLANTNTAIIGGMDTDVTNCRYNLPYKGGDPSYSYWSWNTVNKSTNFINENVILELNFNYLNDRKVTLDNLLISSNLPTLNVGNRSLFLFDINRNGIPYYKGKSRIYIVKISNDNQIIREFIPCYRKSDNVVGMYDIVNNVFYTNKGTGEFVAGPEK